MLEHRQILWALGGFLAASVAGGGRELAAQTFPGDDAYAPLLCGSDPMTDLFRDESGAIDERDIVGDDGAAAGWLALDDDFLYLRLRLDADPAPGGAPRPFAWGMEFDLDGDLTTYEVLIRVDGNSGDVAVYENTVTTVPNDPNDPADEPPVADFDFATHGGSAAAAGSSFGGNDDFFLDIAAPWSALEPLGMTPSTTVVAWAASSSSRNSLNGDFACHDGSTGEPSLSDIASDPTVPGDPDPPPPGSGDTVLEGGGGCRTAGAGGGPLAWLALAWLALLSRRRRPVGRSE
jgi:MYXO-CTERM domain-containing protein